VVRSLYDCPEVLVGSEGAPCRVVVATHPASKKKSPVGLTRAGVVYELFFTTLPQHAFTASDVVEIYLHRGAFEPQLSDEDDEQDPDRWCSHAACGQECWQIVSQWVWNLRLEVGHHLEPTPLRTTEFAPAIPPVKGQAADSPALAPGYGSPATATSWKAGRFSGKDFALQPDGTLRCPVGKTLHPTEQRTEDAGALRVLYAARIVDCRACPVRAQCQWHGHQTTKPRRVSLLWHPSVVGAAPLLWHDWSRRQHRRACIHLLRPQCVEVQVEPANPGSPAVSPAPRSRAKPGPLSPLLGSAAGTQCPSPNGWPGDNPPLWRPHMLCHLARFSDGLNFTAGRGVPLPRNNELLRVAPHGFFLASFASFPAFLLLVSLCLFLSLLSFRHTETRAMLLHP